jgi:outer membrane protein assembly factor BamB
MQVSRFPGETIISHVKPYCRARRVRWAILAAGIILPIRRPAAADDWPAYRHDAARSACAPRAPADALRLQWTRDFPRRQPLFGHDLRTCPDFSHEPIVAGKTLYVGLDADGSLVALDAETGRERWRFYTNGPIRFAPVAWDGAPAAPAGAATPCVFVASDDGCLYALDAAAGRPLWKLVGAPSSRKIVQNERVASNWPASASPLLHDGVLYVAFGIWPVDGVLLYAVDARTGRVLQKQVRFDTVVLGYSCWVGDRLVMPSGGLHLSAFEPKTGAWQPSGAGDVKNQHTCESAAFGDGNAFCGNKAYALRHGYPTYYTYLNAELHGRFWTPVIDGMTLYGVNEGIFRVARVASHEAQKAAGGKSGLTSTGTELVVCALPDAPRLLSPLATPAKRDRSEFKPMAVSPGVDLPAGWMPRQLQLKAGNRLYASGPGAVAIISEPAEGKPAAVVGAVRVDGEVTRAIVADDRLFVFVREGRLSCFGPAAAEPVRHALPAPPPAGGDDPAARHVEAILKAAGPKDGYAVVWGLKDGTLAERLRRAASLRAIGIDPDGTKVDRLRRGLGERGLLDGGLDLRVEAPGDNALPPYVASLIVSEDLASGGFAAGRQFIEVVFAALRPYGGTACFGLTAEQHAALEGWVRDAKLPGAAVTRAGDLTLVVRQGALPGAAEWAHERGDPANTLSVPDTRIRLPLGLLWCGGPASEFRLQGGGDLAHGPEVVEGRMILVGDDVLRAVDAYTGRLLWRAELPKIQHFHRVTPKEMPETPAGLIPAYHISRTRPPNLVAMPDFTYACLGEDLLVLATADGREASRVRVPIKDPGAKTLCWGRVRVDGDLLLATAFDPQDLRDTHPGWHMNNERCKDKLMMRWLFAIDRRTGALLWSRRAKNAFINNGFAIGNGRVYLTDVFLTDMLKGLRETGREVRFSAPTLYGLDLKTGREAWARPLELLTPKVAYAAERDLVVLGYRNASRYADGRWEDPPKQPEPAKGRYAPGQDAMQAFRGATGEPVWRVQDNAYADPILIIGDTIITRHGLTFDLLTGKRKPRLCTITGLEETWHMPTAMCSYEIGSAFLVSRQAGLDDLESGLRFGIRGIRPGCVPSMVPANGVLSDLPWRGFCPSAEFRSAVTLTHRPDGATFGAYPPSDSPPGPIRRLALNLGDPGDTACDGKLWLAPHPAASAARGRAAAGASLPLYHAAIEPETARVFCNHPCAVRPAMAGALPAVAASGVEGLAQLRIAWNPDARRRGDGAAPAGSPARGAAEAAAYPPVRYTVRLHFAEPREDVKPGDRVFAVAIQGAIVLDELDVVKEAGGPRRAIVKTFDAVTAADALRVDLTPRPNSLPALLCGIEVVDPAGSKP